MSKGQTEQVGVWTGEFGEKYTDRTREIKDADVFNEFYVNRYGISRDEMYSSWLEDVPKDSRLMEMGTNLANQLRSLERVGFENLYGVEIQKHVVEEVRKNYPQFGILQSPGQDIPFKNEYFDLVFTNNVLIHISPSDISDVMDEMYRVSKRWIFGIEYFAPEFTEINYRGHTNLLWKADYASLFLDRFPDLKLVKSEELDCLDDLGNVDKVYLLEKAG